MRWARNVACVGRGEVCTGFWWGDVRERPLGRPSVDGKVMLKWNFKKWNGWHALD
jgi:hypothetical protein